MVEALGMIKKGTQKKVNEIRGNLSFAKIEKVALNYTACIFRRTLSLYSFILNSLYTIFTQCKLTTIILNKTK